MKKRHLARGPEAVVLDATKKLLQLEQFHEIFDNYFFCLNTKTIISVPAQALLKETDSFGVDLKFLFKKIYKVNF